jgi:hypothetical protein
MIMVRRVMVILVVITLAMVSARPGQWKAFFRRARYVRREGNMRILRYMRGTDLRIS